MSGRPHLVLVGGGHAHVQVLTAFRDRPVEAAVTLISEAPDTPYSGMLPGCVAGLYSREEIHIDLAALARSAGVPFVLGRAVGLDRVNRRVVLEGGEPVPYDVISLDIGIRPNLSGIAGAEHHAVAVKPIAGFLDRFDKLMGAALTTGGPRRIAVIGGGPAGVELALAIRARLHEAAPSRSLDPHSFTVTLVSSGRPVERLNARARSRVERALATRGIVVRQGRVVALDESGATLEDGGRLPADAAIVATHARPAEWLRASGLPTTRDGSVALRPTLQAVDDDDVFAAGDCGTLLDHPREKAGVFAVRQGPVLARNLRARLAGKPLETHRPQRSYLTLIATGDGEAVGARGRWIAFSGRWAFAWKDRIDRAFMARFRT